MELKRTHIYGNSGIFVVLIVPYGIETLDFFIAEVLEICVNCTLWN